MSNKITPLFPVASQNFIRLNPFISVLNGNICGRLFFDWVNPLFSTNNMDWGYDWIYAFRNFISAKVYILSDDGVTQIYIILKKHARIITQVIFFPGIGLVIMSHRG